MTEEDKKDPTKDAKEDEEPNPEFPFSEIFLSPLAKRGRDATEISVAHPLVIHLPEVHRYFNLPADAPFSTHDYVAKNILIAFEQAIAREYSKKRTILLIGSSHDPLITANDGWGPVQIYDDAVLRTLGSKPMKNAVTVVPVISNLQSTLLEDDKHAANYYESMNTRTFKRMIREVGGARGTEHILQPYTEWDFVRSCADFEVLQKESLDFGDAAELISDNVDEVSITKALDAALALGHGELGARRSQLINDWSKARYETPEEKDKWAFLPEKAREAVRTIQNSPPPNPFGFTEASYVWEKQFLSLIINPDNVSDGWKDIELETDTKEAVRRVLTQRKKSSRAYGILKKGRIGGALLYGPPGTGKTHLARVLARESGCPMLSVKVSDISHKWVGDTPKAIKGLFNLARMLAPSIVFIDEADSLFRRRTNQDHSWETDQTNQFLTEMEGLDKIQKEDAPFVILATNFPQHLDQAALRRVPTRLYIGMPKRDARSRIFGIFLKDEDVDEEVDLEELGNMTHGYSGSDIQTMCVQAALACEDEEEDSGLDEGGRRLLKKRHFEKAFRNTAPTVSSSALSKIQAFAKDFDPGAVEKMQVESNATSAGIFGKRDTKGSNIGRKFDSGEPAPKQSNLFKKFSSVDLKSKISNAPTKPIGITPSGSKPKSNDVISDHPPSEFPPLTPGSKQIRVLSVNTAPTEKESDSLADLHFTLETADLEDWSSTYKEYMAAISSLQEDRQQALLGWLFDCIHGPAPDSSKVSNWGQKIATDIPVREWNRVQLRYNWGDYIALSYVWGDSTNRKPIYVNGRQVLVTQNLFDVLQTLRNSPEVTENHLKLWIDALCINQDDSLEKSTEVRKMDLIYSQALMGRGWLGNPPVEMSIEFEKARAWLDSIKNVEVASLYTSNAFPSADIRRAVANCLASISRQPYWERLWTIQEIALPQSLLFWSGAWSFSPLEITKLSAATSNVLPYPCASRLNTFRLQHYNFEPANLNMGTVVSLAQGSKATDTRDMVYGLLAMLRPSVATRIQPRYDSEFSAQDACVMLSKIYLEEECNLNFLSVMPDNRYLSGKIPRWAINLSVNIPSISDDPPIPACDAHVKHAEFGRFHANADLELPLRFPNDGLILECDGIFVDHVESLGATAVRELPTNQHSFMPMEPESERTPDERAKSLHVVDEAARLSLARTFWMDSDYEFSQGPSLLDVPWSALVGKSSDTDSTSTTSQEDLWSSVMQRPGCKDLSHELLPNARFSIDGVALRDYFTNSEMNCSSPTLYSEMLLNLRSWTSKYRLCCTGKGSLGLVPKSTRLQDRIVVLAACNMPVVLRSNGSNHEIVGTCFVDGLMKGEAVAEMEQGKLKKETVRLC